MIDEDKQKIAVLCESSSYFFAYFKCDKVGLIERKKNPYQGKLALPGGFVDEYEEVTAACVRELEEETHLALSPDHAKFVGVFGKEGRDPRGWTVSVVYFFEVSKEQKSKVAPGSDSAAVHWFPLSQLPDLAFDHKEIIAEAITRK